MYQLLPMKRGYLLVIFLFSTFLSFAQPVYSPERRAELETEWMRDSLNATPAQVKKISRIALDYQRNIDKVINKSGTVAKKLWAKKDAQLKTILNKKQFQRYYTREKRIRELAKIKPIRGDRQPY